MSRLLDRLVHPRPYDRGPQHHPIEERMPTPARRIPFLCQDISSEQIVGPLLLLAFTSGLLDAATYSDFLTFAANQTGNVVILTVAAASIRGAAGTLRRSGVSLASYLVSGFIAGQLGHMVGPRRRGWLILSSVVQVAFLLVPTALVYTNTVQPGLETNAWILMLFLAASSGLQVAIARNCGVGEIPTAMLSSPMYVPRCPASLSFVPSD